MYSIKRSLAMFVDMSNVLSVSAFVPTVSSHIRSLHTSHLLISRICTSHESHFPRFPKSTVLFFLSFQIQCISLRLAGLFFKIASEHPKRSRQTAHMQSFSLSLQFADSLQTVWNCSCCSCIMLYSLYSRCILRFGLRTKNLHGRSCRQRFQRCLSLEQNQWNRLKHSCHGTGSMEWRHENMEKHGETWRNIRTWGVTVPLHCVLKIQSTVMSRHVYPNETPTFSSKATNRSSWTAEVDWKKGSTSWQGQICCGSKSNRGWVCYKIDGSKFPCRRKLVQSSCEMGTILIPISKCFKLRRLEVMMHTCIHCLC